METTTTVSDTVTAEIAAVLALLVEVDGETVEARYSRLNRLSLRLETAMAGHALWTPESKEFSAAVGRVFRFRSWGK